MRPLLLAASCVLSAAFAAAAPALPDRPASGRVLDQTGSLSDAGKARIQGVSDELESRTGAELAVAVVTTLDGMDAADYANRLFRAWGIGKKGKDNGALILVCPAERKSRIEVGYGLEGQLPDALAGRILKDELRPYFQESKFEDGILFGARRVEEIVSGRPASGEPPPRSRRRSSGGTLPLAFALPFFSIFVVLGGLAIGAALASLAAGSAGGAFLLVWGGMFSGIPLFMAKLAVESVAFFCLVGLWVWALASAFIWSRKHPDALKMKGGSGGSGGVWSSGGSDWSSGGGDWGGGGGDFGGGSSGGGGASDSW